MSGLRAGASLIKFMLQPKRILLVASNKREFMIDIKEFFGLSNGTMNKINLRLIAHVKTFE